MEGKALPFVFVIVTRVSRHEISLSRENTERKTRGFARDTRRRTTARPTASPRIHTNHAMHHMRIRTMHRTPESSEQKDQRTMLLPPVLRLARAISDLVEIEIRAREIEV